jgi:hypothetical protein
VKYSFDNAIPTHRIVFYSIVASLIPVICAIAWTHSTLTNAENDKEMLKAIGEKIQIKEVTQEGNRQILLRFQKKDPLFLHRRLEPLSLLPSETSILRARLSRSALPDDTHLEKRLSLLSSENAFCFVEGSTEVTSSYKETVENQNKIVEVENADLLKVFNILDSTEDSPDPQQPHLIISEARLERKKGLFQETWSLMLKVIRREY